jgi:uncharacterized protein YjiS (DUF1127 family)
MSTASALASLVTGSLATRGDRKAINLWVPPHRRLAAALVAAAHGLYVRLADAAQQRAQVRRARRERAALAALDSRTLRDIGLGDWVTSARDDDSARVQRELALRGY